MNVNQLEEFVAPFYAAKDAMHGLEHIRRVYKMAQRISKGHDFNLDALLFGTYFHGIIIDNEISIKNWLAQHHVAPELIERSIMCAKESNKDAIPESLEGKIVHDAHLLEGGKSFGIIKSLLTGTLRGQSLIETIRYYQKNLHGKFSCAFPEHEQLLQEREKFTDEIIQDLLGNI